MFIGDLLKQYLDFHYFFCQFLAKFNSYSCSFEFHHSLILSQYVSVIKNTKRPKYKLIIPFYFIKKSIFYRNRPIFEYQNLNIELFGRFDVSDINWLSSRHLVNFNLLAIDRKIIAQNDCHNNQARSTCKYSFTLKLDHVSPFPVFYQVSHCLPASNILAHQLINLLTGFGIL